MLSRWSAHAPPPGARERTPVCGRARPQGPRLSLPHPLWCSITGFAYGHNAMGFRVLYPTTPEPGVTKGSHINVSPGSGHHRPCTSPGKLPSTITPPATSYDRRHTFTRVQKWTLDRQSDWYAVPSSASAETAAGFVVGPKRSSPERSTQPGPRASHPQPQRLPPHGSHDPAPSLPPTPSSPSPLLPCPLRPTAPPGRPPPPLRTGAAPPTTPSDDPDIRPIPPLSPRREQPYDPARRRRPSLVLQIRERDRPRSCPLPPLLAPRPGADRSFLSADEVCGVRRDPRRRVRAPSPPVRGPTVLRAAHSPKTREPDLMRMRVQVGERGGSGADPAEDAHRPEPPLPHTLPGVSHDEPVELPGACAPRRSPRRAGPHRNGHPARSGAPRNGPEPEAAGGADTCGAHRSRAPVVRQERADTEGTPGRPRAADDTDGTSSTGSTGTATGAETAPEKPDRVTDTSDAAGRPIAPRRTATPR